MKTYCRFFSILSFLLLIVGPLAKANDRKFGYTYETSVLPVGVRELELWNTFRQDRSYFYRRLDQRIEFEFGVATNLQTALYLNTEWKVFDDSAGSGNGNMGSSVGVSISNEWKLKLMDRVADPVGAAIYAEATLGLHESEWEAKLILDKQAGPFLFALNTVVEYERETAFEHGREETSIKWKAVVVGGVAYALADGFSAGIEARTVNTYAAGTLKASALYAGPVVAYAADSYWATLTVMPQLTAFTGATTNGLNLRDHEKLETRLLFSFHL